MSSPGSSGASVFLDARAYTLPSLGAGDGMERECVRDGPPGILGGSAGFGGRALRGGGARHDVSVDSAIPDAGADDGAADGAHNASVGINGVSASCGAYDASGSGGAYVASAGASAYDTTCVGMSSVRRSDGDTPRGTRRSVLELCGLPAVQGDAPVEGPGNMRPGGSGPCPSKDCTTASCQGQAQGSKGSGETTGTKVGGASRGAGARSPMSLRAGMLATLLVAVQCLQADVCD